MWPGMMGGNISFADGEPRATRITHPTCWAAEAREGLNEMSHREGSPVVFQLFASSMVSPL